MHMSLATSTKQNLTARDSISHSSHGHSPYPAAHVGSLGTSRLHIGNVQLIVLYYTHRPKYGMHGAAQCLLLQLALTAEIAEVVHASAWSLRGVRQKPVTSTTTRQPAWSPVTVDRPSAKADQCVSWQSSSRPVNRPQQI